MWTVRSSSESCREGLVLGDATPPLQSRRDRGSRDVYRLSRGARRPGDFLDDGKSPPWDHASELLADGLIDTHLAVTPRGRRALWCAQG